MGESASKAMMLGIGMLVTLVIASSIFSLFSQMRNIYNQVGNTNTDIMKGFGDYPMYNNTEVTGLDVINCANKYCDEMFVVVSYSDQQINTQAGIEYINYQYDNGYLKYEDKFRAIVEDAEYDGVQKKLITFTKI